MKNNINKKNSFFVNFKMQKELIKIWNQNFKYLNNLDKTECTSFNKLILQHKSVSRTNLHSWIENNNLDEFENISNTKFVGYQILSNNANIIKVVDENFQIANDKKYKKGYLIIDETPFYPTMGGQGHDVGVITLIKSKCQIYIDNVIKKNNIILHHFSLDDSIQFDEKQKKIYACIDVKKRLKIANNHSATHLLHKLIKKIFHNSCQQKGSAINDKQFTFDFNYHKDISALDIKIINLNMNKLIKDNLPRELKIISLNEALKTNTIEHHFQEKYQEKVRLISFGDFSHELCSGTHVFNTKEIEAFYIISCKSKGKNIYRITAITSYETIKNYFYNLSIKVNKLINKFKIILINNPNILINQKKDIENLILKLFQANQFLNWNNFNIKFISLLKNNKLIEILNLFEIVNNKYLYIKKFVIKQNEIINNKDNILFHNLNNNKYLIKTNLKCYLFETSNDDEVTKIFKLIKNKNITLELPNLFIAINRNAKNNKFTFAINYTALKNINIEGINILKIAKSFTKKYNGKVGGNIFFARGYLENRPEKFWILKQLRKL